MKATRILYLLYAVLLASIPILGEAPDVTYTHGQLSIRIPYHATHAGSGTLSVELLDPEDHILGHAEKTVEAANGDGIWRQSITPEKPLPVEDLVWERIRYHFAYDGEKTPIVERTDSVSQILLRPVVRILGQKSYLAGSGAAVRIIVTDANNKLIPGGGVVKVELLVADRKPNTLFSGKLNRHGTTEAQIHFPDNLIGSYQLHFIVDTSIGSTEYMQTIELEDKASILLTTEKPVYQPGQTLHIRALALDRANHKAESRKLIFEVEDSRGNKVFKKITETDNFGIASTEFTLADEVNLGTYHVRALMGDTTPDAASKAEIALNIERYVLPKFKVAVEFAEKDNKPKRDYRPGEHVTGTIHANYFFGKPVDGAEITVKASAMDVSVYEASSTTGKTDKDGNYHFDLKLPDYFAGRPISAGAARALVEATVKDSAGHAETRGEPITVSQYPILITAIPEGGNLIPGLENQVFILTSYADGTPANTSLTIHHRGTSDQRVATDNAGVAVVRILAGGGNETLKVEADDHRGNLTTNEVTLQSRGDQGHIEDQILLRTARAVYRTGDHIQLKVLSTHQRGAAYIDIVKDGQTILTRDLDIEDGKAEISITATPAMSGTLDFDAYLFGRDAQPIGDHRLIFVQPPDELKIETTADAVAYKPGGEARIRFRVTNSHGEGVSAALGLQIVDEAVFALSEKQPGFAKVFFYLEQEVMKPRFEIHSISMNDVVSPANSPEGPQPVEPDLAARALFSATEMTHDETVDTELGRTTPQDRFADFHQRYQAVFQDQVGKLARSISDEVVKSQSTHDIKQIVEKLRSENSSQQEDSWGTQIRIEPAGWTRGKNKYYRVISAGPDQKFGDGDDLSVYIEDRSGSIVGSMVQRNGGTVELQIEHEVGPFTANALANGLITDPSGAVVPGATVLLRESSTGHTRTAHANAVGQFSFTALPAGRYNIVVSSAGFMNASRDFTVKPRDRAAITVTLAIGATTETVEVSSEASVITVSAAPMALRNEMGAGMGGAIGRGVAAGAHHGMMLNRNGRAFAANGMFSLDARAVAKQPGPTTADGAAPHVRSWFPEALYINPEILTDGKGTASITIPIADSITTWRMAMLASTPSGALGTGASSLKVFQDFFVDLDLPVTLTQGDRVTIPVAIYNYAGMAGDVSLKLEPEDWFSLIDDNSEKNIAVESGHIGNSQFTLEAKRIGKFKLTLSAKMAGGTAREDIIIREIEVIPNGREQSVVFNGRLDTQAQHTIHFPDVTVADASSIFVRLYPGPLSQIIEGMDSILRMPGGCFEQTSSSTYPNVLALDYMKQTKKLTPEVHAKAEGYIANGYQRLLTFEVPGGGFSWFGQAPANKILTAYGLMEFNDMSKVSEVDPRLIERTRDWLVQQQQPDGSWKPDTYFINEGATNRYNSDVLRITAYVAWALTNTGYQGPGVEKAKQYIEQHLASKVDPYTLAVIANFAVEYSKDKEFTGHAMQMLIDAHTEKDEQASWSAEETGVYSTGSSAAVETTGLAAQALLKWGQASAVARKALIYIASKKDATGAWGSTQATIIALRALILATQTNAADVHGTVQIALNGKTVETLQLTPENSDLLHQFVFKSIDSHEPSTVQIRFEGTGGLAYQVAGQYFVPWEEKPIGGALSIDVKYDRTKLAQSDIATATATVVNNLDKRANMIMIDLGIPPGFDLQSEDLQDFQEKSADSKDGRLEKFSLTATQAILYFNSLAPRQSLKLKFRLRAKYPIRAQTFQSRVYEYYDPEVTATARPVQLEIDPRKSK